MLKELKEKLDNLPENYAKDIDIVALKALCTVPETEEIVAHVKGLVEKLEAKYVNDDEIKNLIPKDEMTLEKLVELLEEKYATNINFITLKAMLSLEDSKEKEKAIKIYLNKIDSEDEDIKKYFEDKQKKNKINPDMIFVQGGKWEKTYKLLFVGDGKCELFTSDMEVSKYLVTQEVWEKYMGSLADNILISSKGNFKPVEGISWWKALEFCNKMSEDYDLEPVYVIGDDDDFDKLKIKHLNGEVVSANEADFSKTEGFRLPTEVEWEWFARGGNKAIEDGSFECIYSGSNRIQEVAWYEANAGKYVQNVGGKAPNSLGIYDCSGNAWEWCFDSYDSRISGHVENIYLIFSSEKKFIYSRTHYSRRIRGGSLYRSTGSVNNFNDTCQIDKRDHASADGSRNTGFRVVRTAKPKY